MTQALLSHMKISAFICRYGELQRGVWIPPGPALEPALGALPRQAQPVGPLPG